MPEQARLLEQMVFCGIIRTTNQVQKKPPAIIITIMITHRSCNEEFHKMEPITCPRDGAIAMK